MMVKKTTSTLLFSLLVFLIGISFFGFYSNLKESRTQIQAALAFTEQSLVVLTPSAHPRAGEEWIVEFETRGRADLTIAPEDQATIDDLDFLSLTCDGEEKPPQILGGDVIFYPNWECEGRGKVVCRVNVAGKHTLKFQFGERKAFAHNNPGWVSPTGHNDPNNAWDNETKAYDEQTGTHATSTCMYGSYCNPGWSHFIELTHAALTSNKIRFKENYCDPEQVDIDVYNDDNQWVDIYQGSFSCTDWEEKSFSADTITRVRFRFYTDNDWGSGPHLGEVDFYECGANGTTCSTGSECCSGHCVDGYCCNTACTETCKACNITGHLGTCTNIPDGQDPDNECSATECGTGNCNGNGACGWYTSGEHNCPVCKTCQGATSPSCVNIANHNQDSEGTNLCGVNDEKENCAAGTACSGGTCSSGSYCNAAWAYCSCQGDNCYNDGGSAYYCQGACDGSNNCDYAANCDSVPTNDSLTFTNPYTGGSNDAVADDSTEWNFQAVVSDSDGYANLATVVLRLANSSDNTPPYDALKFTWTESSDSFSETADSQNCATITSTASDSSCSGNTCTLDFKIKFNSNFSAYITNYNAQLYTTDDASATKEDTYVNFYQVKKANGQACSGGSECASGHCVDGVCCNTACTGTCKACNLAGSEGTCSNVPNHQQDSDTCTAICKECDGSGNCVNQASGQDYFNQCSVGTWSCDGVG